MALPTVLFNSGTGSDTAASGAGPTVALSGTNAVTVATTNTISLATDAPDLSGVATDGSAVLWVASTSGRRWSKITAVNNATKVITTQDNYANSETKSWAIGGKRLSLNASTLLGSDCYEGWTIQLEADDSSLTATFPVNPTASAADGKLTIQGDSTTTKRTITQTANAANFTVSAAIQCTFANLKFTCSNVTKTAAVAIGGAASAFIKTKNCIFGDATNKLTACATRTSGSPQYTFDNCEMTTLITGTVLTGTNVAGRYFFCFIHGGASHGVTGSSTQLHVIGCIITGNAGDGINVGANALNMCHSNTVHGNTGDGLDSSSATSLGHIFNNNFTGNGGFGWNSVANSDNLVQMNKDNNYGTGVTANTSGAYNNISAGTNDQTVDPQYTNAAGFDFSVGTNLKALGTPSSLNFVGAMQSATKSYVDIGAAQRQEAASGGLPVFVRKASTVMRM